LGKRDLPLADRLAFYLLKGMSKASRDYDMIADGDRIAVAVSGGKDSLALLSLLRYGMASSASKYDLLPVHIRQVGQPCLEGTAVQEALERYAVTHGHDLVVERMDTESWGDCARCSYLRRKALFAVAARHGCSKIALGHHANDAAETTLLNLAFGGRIATLMPRRDFFGGRFVVIRPMIYLEERDIARYAQVAVLPVQESTCLSRSESGRALAGEIVRMLERRHSKVKVNLFRAAQRAAGEELGKMQYGSRPAGAGVGLERGGP
jgi:tRNA 2-thiocytidine biosynthesis protein TtcA